MEYPKINRFLLCLILFLIFWPSSVKAEQVDSIRIAVDNILNIKENKFLKNNDKSEYFRSGILRIDQYLKAAMKYKNSNYDSLFYFSQKAIKLS